MNLIKKMKHLTPRQQQILKTIVELYLQGYNEISSLMLKSFELFDISSATIRNELSELTQKGYLKKTHYASGRIPTLAAFQVYINQLFNNNSNLNRRDPILNNKFKTIPVLSLSITEVLVYIINYMSNISTSTCFILYDNLTLIKNISTLNNQLLNLLPNKNIASLMFSKITNMLENTKSTIQLLKELYAQYAINSIAIIPIEPPIITPTQDIFISYSLFKLSQRFGALGIVGKPSRDYIPLIKNIFELSSILSAI